MKITVWHEGMSDKEARDLGYWERNLLALKYADGWYEDLVDNKPRYPNWRRVLSLEGGSITFHIPDNFDVGNLQKISPNWDGHTTEEKWRRVMNERDIKPASDLGE